MSQFTKIGRLKVERAELRQALEQRLEREHSEYADAKEKKNQVNQHLNSL